MITNHLSRMDNYNEPLGTMCPWHWNNVPMTRYWLCYIYVTICGTLYGHPTTDPFCPRNRCWDAVAAVWASPHCSTAGGPNIWQLRVTNTFLPCQADTRKRDLSMMKFTSDICNLVLGWSLHGTLPHVATFPASSTEWIRETHCFSPISPLCWTARAANWWWPIYLCMYVCIYLWWHIYL